MMNTASQKPSEILNLSLNSTNQRLEHLAVILDGNRRWARANGVSTREGYRKGGEAVHRLLSWCEENSIPLVTLWPLSKDNLKREPSEVEDLLITIAEVIEQFVDSGKWRLTFFWREKCSSRKPDQDHLQRGIKHPNNQWNPRQHRRGIQWKTGNRSRTSRNTGYTHS